MSENITAPYARPDRPPQVFEEINPQDFVNLGRAAGTLAFLPLPESVKDHAPTAYAPILDRRATLGYAAKYHLPALIGALPTVQLVKEQVEADTDITGEDLARHMPAVRKLIPLAQTALRVAPAVASNGSYSQERDKEQQLRPVRRKLTMLKVASGLAGLVGKRKKFDAKLAGVAATYINGHREEVRGFLDDAYDQYVAPAAQSLQEFVEEFPEPRKQLMQEARTLADEIWLRAGDEPNSRAMGRAIEAELQSLQQDKQMAQASFPLLSKLGIGKLPELPRTIALDSSLVVTLALDITGTPHSNVYTVTDKHGDAKDKTDIPLSDALGIVAEDIMHTLESAAAPDPHAAGRLYVLRNSPRPLRRLASRKPSIEAELRRLGAFAQLARSGRNLLPVDAAHARRIAAALEHAVKPKPRR